MRRRTTLCKRQSGFVQPRRRNERRHAEFVSRRQIVLLRQLQCRRRPLPQPFARPNLFAHDAGRKDIGSSRHVDASQRSMSTTAHDMLQEKQCVRRHRHWKTLFLGIWLLLHWHQKPSLTWFSVRVRVRVGVRGQGAGSGSGSGIAVGRTWRARRDGRCGRQSESK